ncbi:hypothetical protein L484_001364 [Morus notabilis]|uniref:Uncharacterized protein n=1 Tax=Morus notabilis TaxID=981085 RepID=W9SL96_9ROSA|nr:hypothetical protein L484_001364 [Morus notabilis]
MNTSYIFEPEKAKEEEEAIAISNASGDPETISFFSTHFGKYKVIRTGQTGGSLTPNKGDEEKLHDKREETNC